MAKNLKLNIKNTQLANALKLKHPAAEEKPKKISKRGKPEAELPITAPPPLPPEPATPVPVEEPTAAQKPKLETQHAVMQEPAPKKEPSGKAAAKVETPAPLAPPPQAEERKKAPPSFSTPPPRAAPSFPRRPPGTPPYQRPYQRLGPPTTASSYRTPSTYPPAERRAGALFRPGGAPFRPGAPFPPGKRALPPQMPPTVKPVEEKPARKIANVKEFHDFKPLKKTAARSFDSRDKQGLRAGEDEGWRKRRPSHKVRTIEEESTVRPKEITIRIPTTVKDLASEMKLKAAQIIAKLFMQGMTLTLNDLLDDETLLQLIGQEFDCKIHIDKSEEQRLKITSQTIKEEIQQSAPEQLSLRPPVVAFMGHVDHGKTSLIDAIRKSNRAAGEAGAITQHIGAFKCHTAVGDLTILDTPGHEAFSEMRSRGANVTDIVVLVIAGDEGMRTQTIEAMNQAKEGGVPIVVALNKSDKPNFNADNVYRQLADNNLLPESWGGNTITVNCSALTGVGIKELLEMLALQAEVLELKANPQSRARGTVLESEMHKGMGAVATVLVRNGTLHLDDAVVFDQHWGRIKTMQDEHGAPLLSAGPSTPIAITGLSGIPEAGSEFIVVKDEREARELSQGRTEGQRNLALQKTKRQGIDTMMQKKVEKKVLNLILRADVQGSLEALKASLLKIPSTKVEINIVAAGVGEISESDIQRAAASKATILGFHTAIERHAESLIKEHQVIVKVHDVIYHAIDDVKALMLALLDKIEQETDAGRAEVKTVFKSSQLGSIAGCLITEGTIKRSHHIRLLRGNKEIWKGPIASLKRVKEDVREVSKGHECGILLQGFSDIKEGDILQAFEITYLQQEL